jgi:flagellar protein FlaG
MEAISNKVVSLGSVLNNAPVSAQVSPNKDAEIISKVASIPLPSSDIKASSQEVRNAAEVAMRDIQHFISSQASSVRISKDQASGHMVVQMVDPNSGEVLRTLPSEELLRIARSFEILGNKLVHQLA